MNKDKILNLFESSKLPLEKLKEGCLDYKEFLFNEIPEKPSSLTKKQEKHSDSFIIENKITFVSPPTNTWRNNYQPNNTGTSNNNKGFIKGNNVQNIDNTMLDETKVQEKAVLDDTMNDDQANLKFFKDYVSSSESDKRRIPENIQKFQPNNKPQFNGPNPNNINIPFRQFEQIKIENIYNLNKKLSFPEDKLLWYIFHPIAQATYGPISSNKIHEMYNTRMIDGNWLVRLIDIFEFDNAKSFQYVKLNLINNSNWADTVHDSKLLQYSELYKLSSNILNSNTNNKINKPDLTLNLEQSEIKANNNEQTEFIDQNLFVDSNNKNNNIPKNEINFAKEVDEADDAWEVVNKKKKTKLSNKDNNKHMIGLKPKEKIKEETRTTPKNNNKEDIDTDFVFNKLKQQNQANYHKKDEPDYEAFGEIINDNDTNKKKSKKFKEANVKLGK